VDRVHVNAVSTPHPSQAVKDPEAESQRLGAWLSAWDRAAAEPDRPNVLYRGLIRDGRGGRAAAAGPDVFAVDASADHDAIARLHRLIITETPSRVTLENDSVKLAFDVTTNCVPCELVDKQGSGQNLIVNNFCLYYQYVEGGAIRSVNEGYPGGRIANGRHKVEKQAGAATVEFRGETPHFRLTRRVTLPATGPVVKFVCELGATTSDIIPATGGLS
jgi:hypothetical protein